MIAWVDIETTGLDVDGDRLLEVGFIITDDELEELDRFSCVLYHHLGSVEVNELVRQMHTDNGLWEECASSWSLQRPQAEEFLSHRLTRALGAEKPPLGGSTVGFDRKFLEWHFPSLVSEHFSHRNIDISSVKELAKRFDPELAEREPAKREVHRVLPDIEDSIEACRYYVLGLFGWEGS